jgi:hypothetical protein
MLEELLDECYTVSGTGGWESCMVIQERLQEHGLCSCFRWRLDPSGNNHDHRNWRFLFETHLPVEALHALLGRYVTRYNVQFR